jgi:mannose-6-phosphate isomerase-like protein (cupin superfamily)
MLSKILIKQIENGLDLHEIAKNIAAVYDTSLLPGERIPPHYHPDFEEIYYVLSGYGLMSIGEEKQEISRGDVVYIPAPAPHTLMNTGNVPLRFVTVSVRIAKDKKDDVQPYIA